MDTDQKIVFVDKQKWGNLVSEYKEKSNNKIKYEYITEPELEEQESEIESLANDIFGNVIVEE